MSFILISLFLISPANAADAPSAAKAPKAAEVTVTKAQFKTEFVNVLADKFCEEKRYFRVCFNAKAEDCKKSVAAAATACLAEVEKQLPEKFTQPTDGQQWGQKLGACAGTKYELENSKKLVNSADCKDLSKWK